MAATLRMSFVWMQMRIQKERGEISASLAIGCLILLVAYLAFPQAFTGFFKYLMHTFFSALNDSFGSQQHGGNGGGASGAHHGAGQLHFNDGIGNGQQPSVQNRRGAQ